MAQKMKRKPFQGVVNILGFNRHFFLTGFSILLVLTIGVPCTSGSIRTLILILIFLGSWSMSIPIIVSYYIYDLSGFYELKWLSNLNAKAGDRIACVNAGFDETGSLIREKLNTSIFTFDFYEIDKHTEVSIKRARDKYPPDQNAIRLSDYGSPLAHAPFDFIFVVFAAHEIRDQTERSAFFSCLRKSIADNGRVVVIEHLRDLPNLVAYTIGAFHFYSKNNWRNVFSASDLKIENEIKHTPFVSLFQLKK